jgi:hypothetical protein
MTTRGLPIAIAFLVAVGALLPPARAGVVVLANQTEGKVTFVLLPPDGPQTRRTLDRREVAPVFDVSAVTIAFEDGGQPRRYTLQANNIYSFRNEGGKLDLFEQPLTGLPTERVTTTPASAPRDTLCTVLVKILADDKEPTVQRVWEERYRRRLAVASEIIERHCRVRFQVVAVGTWTSDSSAHDLEQLIDEFERKVQPDPARLAIGFSGRHQALRDEEHMGGTRGAFRSHILIREWGRQITEMERLEMLVHELGHFLGAVHSPEHQSVMRPDIGDRQARARSFHIGFDAPNTLAMCLVGEELRSRPLLHLCQLPSATKDQLRTVYRALAATLPADQAAPRYLTLLDQSLGLAAVPPERLQAVIAAARSVVLAVTEAAEKNRQLPDGNPASATGQVKLDGDQLTEHYVRQAAAAARRHPQEIAPGAFLLGLGAALDDSPLLRDGPVVGSLWQRLESPSERTARLAALGAPTMHSRHDLTLHFAVSAALTVLVGSQGAEGTGVLKELADAQTGSGFSFVDLSADLAGVLFANGVDNGKIPLSRLEEDFAVRDFLPEVDGLREGIGWDEFLKTYGYPPDARLRREGESLRQRILALPGFQKMPSHP